MNQSKVRRKRYRAELRDRGLLQTDRFTDMMLAVTGGCSHPCAACKVVRAAASLDEKRICVVCRTRMGKLAKSPPAPRQAVLVLEPGAVYVDASFADGIAGLAVVGALGEHSRRIEASTSTQAELLALRWALEIARSGGVCHLDFYTDCTTAWRALRQVPKKFDWTVSWIPRQKNQIADRLAWDARNA